MEDKKKEELKFVQVEYNWAFTISRWGFNIWVFMQTSACISLGLNFRIRLNILSASSRDSCVECRSTASCDSCTASGFPSYALPYYHVIICFTFSLMINYSAHARLLTITLIKLENSHCDRSKCAYNYCLSITRSILCFHIYYCILSNLANQFYKIIFFCKQLFICIY